MQDTGYVPLEKKSPAWVREIKNQAYVAVGNYAGLEALAKRVDPHKTFVGRQGDYRKYAFDVGYPDYEPTPEARRSIAVPSGNWYGASDAGVGWRNILYGAGSAQ